MDRSSTTVLGRLRSAVNKVRFLLRNITATASYPSWRLISLLRSSTPLLRPPRHSFNDRYPSAGLIEVAAEAEDDVQEARVSNASSSGGSSPGGGRVLHRSASSPGRSWEEGDSDVDRKAEAFIDNFYRQLRLEKQVSLELKYCRGFSFTSSSTSLLSPDFSINLSVTSPS